MPTGSRFLAQVEAAGGKQTDQQQRSEKAIMHGHL
jgi:hypothetical protein